MIKFLPTNKDMNFYQYKDTMKEIKENIKEIK